METSAIFPRDRVTIVGVLNTTPDSFSDGGRFVRDGGNVDLGGAVDAAAALVRDGAHVIDVGGESTRPGAREVPVDVEIDRTAPVVEAIAKRLEVEISIDTRKGPVAAASLAVGASIVNDVSGLAFDPDLAEIVSRSGASLLLGHLRGIPESMQIAPCFDDVLEEVGAELAASSERARAAGIPDSRLAVDPGIGFGKRFEDNCELLAHVGRLRERTSLPVAVGPSRKSFLGTLTGDPVECRDAATAAACALAVFSGADAVRVHNVAATAPAVAVARALRDARREDLE